MVDFSYEDIEDIDKKSKEQVVEETNVESVEQPAPQLDSDDFSFKDLENIQDLSKLNKDGSVLQTLKNFQYGLMNQGNAIPFFDSYVRNLYKGFNKEDKDKAYKDILNEELAKSRAIEERSPIATNVGNIAGGFLLPSGGGIAANAVTKLGGKGAAKVAANIAGNAVEGGLQSAAFADEGNRLKAGLIGAGLGTGIASAGAGLSKLVKSGKVASKYAERADEIKASRKNEKTAGEMFEDDLRKRADEVQAKVENEAIDFSDAFRKDTQKAVERSQVLDEELVGTALALQKEQRNLMSAESNLGWEKLSLDKDISVKPLIDELEKAYNNFDPKDPNAFRLKKLLVELQDGEQTISEADLKKKINRFWNEISETEVTQGNRGVWIPLSSRELMRVADKARDILVNKNKAYADIVTPLGKKVDKLKKIAETLNLNKDDASILKKLKTFNDDIDVRNGIAEFKELTGVDLIPQIEKANSVKLAATSPEFKKDLVDIIVNKKSKDKDYKKLVKSLEDFDKENGTKYAQMLNDIRTNNMVETLQKANKFLTIGDKQQASKLDALFGNVLPVDLKPAKDNIFERIFFKGKLQDQAKIKGKDKNTRELLNKFSEFMGQDAEKNLRAIENDNLYDLMGTSQANGSRRVNLGANIGEFIHEGLKKLPGLGKAYGSLIGAAVDNGMLQRGRRELLERLVELEKNPRNLMNPVSNWENKIGTRMVTPRVTRSIEDEERNQQAWDQMFNPTTGFATRESVERQQDINQKYWKRSGS